MIYVTKNKTIVKQIHTGMVYEIANKQEINTLLIKLKI